jgi:hypothetical protein
MCITFACAIVLRSIILQTHFHELGTNLCSLVGLLARAFQLFLSIHIPDITPCGGSSFSPTPTAAFIFELLPKYSSL